MSINRPDPVAFVSNPRNRKIHFIGIKGTGMVALAEVLHARGARITGSDVPEHFFTDRILDSLGLTPRSGFSADNLPTDTEIVIHSAAYGVENPEIVRSDERGIPRYVYPEVLGAFSRTRMSLAIAGVHGKTTTTGIAGSIVAAAQLPAIVIAGSAIAGFGDRATVEYGDRYLIAETCEYRRHFMEFSPTVLLVTSVESDHQDFFPALEDMYRAFVDFGMKIAPGGSLVYCADDPGATEVASRLRHRRTDITFRSYGISRNADVVIRDRRPAPGKNVFRLSVDQASAATDWELHVPGEHLILNAAGAVTAIEELLRCDNLHLDRDAARAGVSAYAGARRRSEILGEVNGILVLDDYGHHPTAIRRTLEGFRDFYPGRRLIVDFMSHTVSRTTALLPEFGAAFSAADVVIVNGIYASAREKLSDGGKSAQDLVNQIAAHQQPVYGEEDFTKAAELAETILKPGDIFVTMGAGDNFRVAELVLRRLKEKSA